MFKNKREKNRIIIPENLTNPISEAESENGKTTDDAVEMARKWVEENKL